MDGYLFTSSQLLSPLEKKVGSNKRHVYYTREKKAHFVGFFFARCARKLMSGTLKYWNLAFLPPLLIMGFKVL